MLAEAESSFLKMKRITEDIKNNTFSKVYLLYGEETYLKLRYRNMLCDAMLPESDTMNRISFSGNKTDPSEIISYGNTFPMFAERRLIIMEDTGFFKNSPKELAEYIADMPEYLHFVFVESEVDKKTALYKAVHKYGTDTEFVRFNKGRKQDRDYLGAFALRKIASAGKKIRKSNMELLIDRAGDDMNMLSNETEKLISYCLEREEITKDDIEKITTGRIDTKVYEISDSVSRKDAAGSIRIYSDIMSENESPMRVLAVLAGQYHMLLMVKALSEEEHMRDDEIASEIGRPPFVVRKLKGTASRYTSKELKGILEKCVEAEERIKTGFMEEGVSVETLIMELCR